MSAIGRLQPFTSLKFMLSDSPLFDTKLPFKKHYLSDYELPLPAASSTGRHKRFRYSRRAWVFPQHDYPQPCKPHYLT
jgi:hypothetical protein